MTDSEREEFVYDLASYYVTKTSNAGLVCYGYRPNIRNSS